MKRQSTALLAAAVLALGAFGCFKDPVSDLQGSPSRVSLSRRFLQPTINETTVVNVQVLDAQGNPLVLTGVTYSSADPAVATIEPLPDSVLRNFPGFTLTKANVIAGIPGTTKLLISANGVSDTITVITYPAAFTGTITPTAVEGGTITITAPALVTFGATTTATGVGAGPLYEFVSRSATTLVYRVASPGTGQQVIVSGAILLGSIALPDLTSSATFAVTVSPDEPANDAAATAPVLALPATIGDSIVAYGSLNGTDFEDWYTLTAAVGDSFEVWVDWPVGDDTDLDIDMLIFRNNGVNGVSFAGGTGANPEKASKRLTLTNGANPKIDVQMYDTHGHSENWPYRITIWRR